MALAFGLLFGLLAAAGALVGAALVLALEHIRHAVVAILLAFATGTLLGAALLGLLPEAAAVLSLGTAACLMLLAVVAFFLLEKWVLWRHCHDPTCPVHNRSVAGYLVLVGDGLHNAVDGLALGTAFVADTRLGMMVGLAVLAHEIPQEVGDFALLLEGGLSRLRALAYNLLSSATVLPGVVVGVLLGEAVEPVLGGALALAAGGFLYVGLADLVPELHRRGWRETLRCQLLPLLAGVALIGGLHRLLA